MQCALVALLVKGYRPSTNEPGHHQTMIQSLPLTLAVDREDWVILDGLRRKRNASDYLGDLVTEDVAEECVARAARLREALRGCLAASHPALPGPGDDQAPH
jgi:hypothetical protein